MPSTTIVFVGEDLCHRIPVMEANGICVVRSACSVTGVRAALAKDGFSAVTFHNDVLALPESVVSTAREMCKAPLVLFRNLTVDCDEQAFDLVIPMPMPPEVWTGALAEIICEAREFQEYSRKLRRERADAREWSQNLREMSARNRTNWFDYDAGFHGGGEGTGKDKLDQ